MSTHCSIAYVDDFGCVHAQYCHFDGYLSHVGEVLNTQHDNHDAAIDLVTGVEIDSLGPEGGVERLPGGDAGPWFYRNLADYFNRVEADTGSSGHNYVFKDGEWYYWNSQKGYNLTKLEVALALG